jgi:AcrR family transcriptional regulator
VSRGEAQTSSALRCEPKQSRSVETCSNILQAAGELFAAHGYEQVTTHQIAARAGVSVGALYRYFADREAIVIALYRQEVAEQRDRVLTAFEVPDGFSTEIRELVRRTVALALELYSERPGLRKVLVEQSRKIPELIQLRREQDEQVRHAVTLILASVQGVTLPDLEAGAYLITLFVESLIDDHAVQGPRREGFDDARITEAAVDFIVRYVLAPVR